jgi:hypothetical protein
MTFYFTKSTDFQFIGVLAIHMSGYDNHLWRGCSRSENQFYLPQN